MSYRKKPPQGLVTERTLRSMLRTIAKKLRTELTMEQTILLLRHQKRLAKQLRKVAVTARSHALCRAGTLQG